MSAGERHSELVYLASVLMVGCSIQSRALTAIEASAGAVSVCNLGLAKSPALADDYLIGHDLIGVFQIGWTALYEEVCMYAARTLVEVAGRLRCADDDLRSALRMLRIAMTRQVHAGAPWRAEASLDVIAMLDQPAWAALVALIAECPVIHGALPASLTRQARAVDARAFAFIANDDDLAMVRGFMESLPELLG